MPIEIKEIRILPPLAIGRLGSSPQPMDNYNLELPPGTGYRQLVPAPTLVVDRASGRILERTTPSEVQFRDGSHHIRPICPFLEVWAIFEEGGDLEPLTKHHLTELGLDASAIAWSVEAVNSKAFRRTGDGNDKIIAQTGNFSDHAVHDFVGQSLNFKPGKSIHLGDVQYIEPSDEFPEIRLRFTPAPGKVYGPVKDPATGSVDDVYDASKGHWPGYYDNKPGTPYPTQPGSIFWGRQEAVTGETQEQWVSYGYLDDMCDGIVNVALSGTSLRAFARISVGPPDFAPDSLPIRAVSDELQQIADGPEVSGSVTQAEAEDILRRAIETIRLLYTQAMNGNPFVLADGKNHNTNNMAVQNFRDTGGLTVGSPIEPINGTGRAWEPIFTPPENITNRRVLGFHEQILTQILAGQTIDLASLLRDYDQTGDYTDGGRAKMPGLMRNADGMLLALTRRMKSIIAAAKNPYGPPTPPPTPGQINPKNRTAQFEHRSEGNPAGTLLTTAVSNNFPGLEFDYRSIWRHVFEGITMYEAAPRVIAVDDAQVAAAGVQTGMLMVSVDGERVWASVSGPRQKRQPTGDPQNFDFQTQGMEWSNAIASVVQKPDTLVNCKFVVEPASPYTYDDLYALPTVSVDLRVRSMFDPTGGEGNAVFGLDIAGPGDMTQGLCSPWQNDYRECSCYYWAAARPDFVNRVEDGTDPITGDNWLQKDYDGDYEVDDRTSDSQLAKFVSYTDLFRAWEELLPFIIAGEAEPAFLHYRHEILQKLNQKGDA